jgi:hypothetical protein
MKVDLKPNEVVVKAGNTDLCFINNQINGKLIVTNQRIYFKSIKEEHNKFNLEIIPRDIKELHYYNTKWIFPNGLNILTKDGDEIRFVIKNREEWAKVINKMY